MFSAAFVAQSCPLSVSVRIVAGRANFPERGCVRSTSRSTVVIPSATRCGWVFDHSRAPFWLRLRRAGPYRGFVIRSWQAPVVPARPSMYQLQVGETPDSRPALKLARGEKLNRYWREGVACFAVPKGQARIAQRFNAGLDGTSSRVPKGRPRSNPIPHPSAVPSGLFCQAGGFPALKRRAILTMSLRDKGTRRPPSPSSNQPV
jgi:hypothetical protein